MIAAGISCRLLLKPRRYAGKSFNNFPLFVSLAVLFFVSPPSPLKDLQLKGISAIYETVLSEIRERDDRDAKRAIAPSRPAEDALVLDTSDMKSDEVLEKVLAYIKEKIKE